MSLELLSFESWLSRSQALSLELAHTAPDREQRGEELLEEIQKLRESGLLALVIDEKKGLSWEKANLIIREISKGDVSAGTLLGQHLSTLFVLRFLADAETPRIKLEQATAEHGWFWANLVTPFDEPLIATPNGKGFVLQGNVKDAFGASVADILFLSAKRSDNGKIITGYVEGNAVGLSHEEIVDSGSLRKVGIGTLHFDKTLLQGSHIVSEEEVGSVPSPESLLIPSIFRLYRANISLGTAWGIFESAKQLTLQEARPWITSGLEKASQDPHILKQFGEFYTSLRAATSLTNRAGRELQQALDQGDGLQKEERAEVVAKVSAALVLSNQVALEFGAKAFDVVGISAVTKSSGLDHRWRDVRTVTLQEPISYKLREIGDYALNNNEPAQSHHTKGLTPVQVGYWHN